jgi:hypothetical protein
MIFQVRQGVFAANSTSETRYPLLDNIEDMLKVIHQEKKEKDID